MNSIQAKKDDIGLTLTKMLLKWCSTGKFDLTRFECEPSAECLKKLVNKKNVRYNHKYYTNRNQQMLDHEKRHTSELPDYDESSIVLKTNVSKGMMKAYTILFLGEVKYLFCGAIENDNPGNLAYHASAKKSMMLMEKILPKKLKKWQSSRMNWKYFLKCLMLPDPEE